MLTNKINIKYDMDNIDKDFDIFQVIKDNKDYYKTNILDSAIYEFKAFSVQYVFGNTALVLFQKDTITEQDFRKTIMKDYKDTRVQRIDILNDEECKKCFGEDNRLLAQLLINSIKSPRIEKFRYNNLTGKLLYYCPNFKGNKESKKSNKITLMHFLEIIIYPGMFLNLEQKTFKKLDCSKKTEKSIYIFDPKTGYFRKKLKTDSAENMYIEGSSHYKHEIIDYFSVKSDSKFQESKLGVMYRFLCDVKNKLDKYITLELDKRDNMQIAKIQKEKKPKKKKDEEKPQDEKSGYKDILEKRKVIIVDEIRSQKTKKIVAKLKQNLTESYNAVVEVGTLSNTEYNIRIIHNEEYYSSNKLSDLHKENLKGYIVQHVTEEDFFKNKNKDTEEDFFKDTDKDKKFHEIDKIVQELIIKDDIKNKTISLYDWNKLGLKKCWYFVIREKIKENLDNDKKHNYYDYYRLKVDTNGNLIFDIFRDFNDTGDEDWEQICYAYDEMTKEAYKMKYKLECLVYSDINNIHAVFLTNERPMPNILNIAKDLKETDLNYTISKEKLIEGLDDFEKKFPEYIKGKKSDNYEEEILRWGNELKDKNEILTYGEIKKILKMGRNTAKSFNRFLHENYNIWVYAEWRDKEFESKYQMSSLTGIRYQYDNSDYLDNQSFVYYVGYNSKEESYPTSCPIRKVVTLGNKLEYEELLPLLQVEFVRNGRDTVLPFPCKYLREYKYMLN